MKPLNRPIQTTHQLALAAGLAVMASGPIASAQTAAGSNGRALDANPQVGSRGTNDLQNQVDYAARNNLITGNVAGGFGFQDFVGYSAPGAFQDSLGSEDLFSYRAASIASAPQAIRFGGATTIRGGNVVVFNNFTTISPTQTAGTTTRLAPAGGVFRVSRDFDNTISYDEGFNAQVNTNTQNTLQNPLISNTVGVFQVADGTALAITADPLLGVRRHAITKPVETTPETTTINLTGELEGLPGLDGELPSNIVPAPGLIEGADFTPQGPADNPELLQRGQFTDAFGRVKPTLELGQIVADPATTGVVTIEQRVAEMQEAIFGPTEAPGATPAPGTEEPENAYTKLLDEIREQSRQIVEDANADDQAPDARPDWMKALQDPTSEQLDSAENSLEATLERLRRSIAGESEASEGELSEADEQRRAEASQAFNELMDDLSYSVRLETLVAERQDRVNALFADAEKELAAGKFLNAERVYRQIRIETPDNPLGLAGLIHAQLGAGMVRSAAFNLRSMFEQHPELIATRYGQNLLPPAERLEWLQGELQRMIDSESSSLDPGMMMAYLGYQVESRQLVRYGLAIAEEASPIDPLLPVLRRIWLEGKPAAEETPTK